jgi:glycosyltransferase involved in cell wall biosynthesis
MQVLQIGKSWFPEDPGGLDRYFYDCIQNFPKIDIAVKGLVVGSSEVERDSLGLVRSFAPSDASLIHRWAGVREQVREILACPSNDYIITSHFALYTLPVLNLLGDRPLVIHFHGPWAFEGRVEGNNALSMKVKLWLEQTCHKRAISFIVLSKAFQRILHQDYGVPLEKIHIVPGGVDFEYFQTDFSREDARKRLSLETTRPTIVTLRRLTNRMGLENLIEAISQVKQQHPDILLCIAGRGPLENSLRQQIETLGLNENVKLLGFVPDSQLVLLYKAANFSIVPTISFEGFGLVVIESLASGTPVLGTPVGGIPEILKPFDSNLLMDGSEPTQIARAITDVLSGKRTLPDSETCKSYVQENYSWPIIAQKLKTIYMAALKTV